MPSAGAWCEGDRCICDDCAFSDENVIKWRVIMGIAATRLEKLERELAAAKADLYAVKACSTCALQFTDDCLLEECMDACSSFAEGDVPYKWRGKGGYE